MDVKKGLGWVWPTITDRASAESAAKQGLWAAVWCAVVTAFVATLSLAGMTVLNGIDASSYVDALLFALIAWRIHHHSRWAAVAGLALYLFERVYAWSNGIPQGSVMVVVLTLMFIHSIRGAIAYHRLTQGPHQAPAAAGGSPKQSAATRPVQPPTRKAA